METKRCYGCMRLKTQPICEHCGFDERKQNATHQLAMGTVLKEQYLVGRVLGQGGFGITYLGWDLYLDTPVAIKEYFPKGTVMRETTTSMEVMDCSGDEGVRFRNNKARFMNEAKMLGKFAQVPEVVQVRNFFQANNTAYIIMEYVDGITLKQYVQDQPGKKLTVAETLRILSPIIQVLCKVHKAGLVHRDINPSNIMMLPGGNAKLLDFGAAKDVGTAASVDKGSNVSTQAILTQGFAPIEQYQRRGCLGPWTDVYSMCGTIYYCLTGKVPTEAPERMLYPEMRDIWAEVEGLTEIQRAALTHGMEPNAEQRTVSMDQLYEELTATSATVPVTPKPVTKTETEIKTTAKETEKKPKPVPKPAGGGEKKPKEKAKKEDKKDRKGLIIGIAAAVLVLAVAIGVFVLPGKTEEPAPETTGTQTVLSGQCGDNVTWSLDTASGAMTIEGSGPMWDFEASWEESPEGSLAPWAEYRDQIQTLTVGGEVTSIGYHAFEFCGNLRSINWLSPVETIGAYAFHCTGLESITIPDSVSVIEDSAFSGNEALRIVNLGQGLEWLKNQAFGRCPALQTVLFSTPALLEEHWDERIFTGDSGNEAPENLTIACSYGSFAWAYAMRYGIPWENGTETTWDEPVLASGECGPEMTWTLFECGVLVLDGTGPMSEYETFPWEEYYDRIVLLYVGSEVNTIASFAFQDCKTLRYLYIPEDNSMGRIEYPMFGNRAFAGSGLVQVELPEGEASTFGDVFNDCESLEYFKTCSSRYSGAALFALNDLAGCDALTKLVIAWNTELAEYQYHLDMTFTPPENLTIYGCPDTWVEEYCTENGIPFVPEIAGFHMEESGQCGDGVYWMLDREQKALVLYGEGDTWNYTASEHPEFYEFREEIEQVFVTYNVTSLGDYLFRDLTSMKSINTGSDWRNDWNDRSNIDTLGEGVFSHCSALESITLPLSARTYGERLFEECSSLRSVNVFSGTLQSCTFMGCTALEEVYFWPSGSFVKDVFGPDDGHDYTQHVTFYVWEGCTAWGFARSYGIPYVVNQLDE